MSPRGGNEQGKHHLATNTLRKTNCMLTHLRTHARTDGHTNSRHRRVFWFESNVGRCGLEHGFTMACFLHQAPKTKHSATHCPTACWLPTTGHSQQLTDSRPRATTGHSQGDNLWLLSFFQPSRHCPAFNKLDSACSAKQATANKLGQLSRHCP